MTNNVTLMGKVTEKKLLIEQQLKNSIEQHNAAARQKEELFNHIKQLQGALQILNELDYVSDQPSDSEPTEGS